MSQRGNSKKTKLRMEEEELDRQLMAAGLLDEGMSFAQKREMAQFLSMSVSSAQEEESQRKHREFEEEKLMEETLNSSINPNKDLPDDSDNSRGSDVVILSSGPDSDSQALKSSQLSKGIFGLDKSQNAKKNVDPVFLCNSDQDMFCDSQGEKREQNNLVTTPASLEKRFEKVISTTSADSSFESAHHKLENTQKTYSNVSSRRGIRKHPTTDDITSPITKAIRRHATVHEVTSLTKVQHNVGTIEKSHSQSLFSSGSSNISVRSESSLQQPIIDPDEDTQLFSPVIGGRKVINGKTVSALQKGKSSNVQESQISNSLEVVRLHTEKSNNDEDSSTDDEIISSPVQSPSTLIKASTPAGVLSNRRLSAVSTPNTSNVNLRLSVSPGMSPAKCKSPIKSDVIDDEATQEINFIPSVSSTDKVLAASKVENVQTHHLDKDSESSSDANDNFSYTIDWKKSVKVFPLSNSDTEPLLRKNMRSEKRSLAYMKHENESVNESKKRIVSLIDISYDKLEQYQESLGIRKSWGSPVMVDKRIKEWTLIRPLQIIRKLLPPTSEESSGIRRATRQTRKVQDQNQAGDSDDSLPNIDSNSQDLNKVIKLKPNSQGSSVNKKFSKNVDDKCRLVNEDSDDDLDDFNIFPSKHREQLGKTTLELADSTPRKHLKLSQDVDYVSSSRLQEDTKKNSQERNINFELNVSDGDNDNSKMDHMSSENYKNSPKRKNNDSLEESRPIKRRKTFMLNVDEDEVASSSNISDNVDKLKLTESSCDTEVTSIIDGDECKQNLSNKKKTEEVEDLYSNRELKKDINFVSSSYEESQDVGIPGPSSSSTDLLILEKSDMSAIKVDLSANRTANTHGVSKSRQGIQIRPGRLKLLSKRNNGKRRDASNEEGDQISSSLEQDTTDIEEIEKVECPLCAREFPLNKIEVHAATCDGQVDSTVEEVLEDKSLFQRSTARSVSNSATTSAAAKEEISTKRPIAATIPEKRPRTPQVRTPPSFARCYLCDDVFPEGDEYAVHVSECDGQQKMVEGIKSPSFTDSPRTWATKRMQRDSNPIQTSNKGRILINKPRSVFEKIEGSGPSRSRTAAPTRKLYDEIQESVSSDDQTCDSDGLESQSQDSEEYYFPDSPIRSFVPISEQTNSQIDYLHQFRDKTRKKGPGYSKVGKVATKTKRKKKSTRGKTRKKSKT